MYHSVGGYKNNVCYYDQPKSVEVIVRMLYSPVPILLVLLSSICVYFYPLTEKFLKEEHEKMTYMVT